MNKFFKIFAVASLLALVLAPMAAFAQEAATETAAKAGSVLDLNSIAASLVIIGAAFGIGHIGASAVASMARQPEASGSINTAMLISAALIEGATFFALIVCLLGILG
ncbi:MAG: ATP synthase F0 subunit C [Thermoguttaceae bacterium]